MPGNKGLQVTVQGDLPPDAMNKISNAVRSAVLDQVAELDLSSTLRESPLQAALKDHVGPADLPETQGISLQPVVE